jgi:hypothetical protein
MEKYTVEPEICQQVLSKIVAGAKVAFYLAGRKGVVGYAMLTHPTGLGQSWSFVWKNPLYPPL